MASLAPFLLFSGPLYYAEGGWYDLKAGYQTQEEAHQQALRQAEEEDIGYCWYQIVDTATGTVVEAAKRYRMEKPWEPFVAETDL